MKDLRQIDNKTFDKLLSGPIDVYEMIDGFYFKVDVSRRGCKALRRPDFREITEDDITLNSIYKDIVEFTNKLNEHHSEIIAKFGECVIGFFYLPVKKFNNIEYEFEDKSFIVNDIYTVDVTKKPSVQFGSFFINLRMDANVYPVPLIKHIDEVDLDAMHTIKEYVLDDASPLTVIAALTDGYTYSDNSISDIEGIIVAYKNKQFKIKVNTSDTYDDMAKYMKLMYKDRVLLNFIHTITPIKAHRYLTYSLDKNRAEKIGILFAEYMNSTNLFITDAFDEEDLLPPHNGYISDLCEDYLTNMVKIIINSNPIYKNAFRIIFYELTSDKKHDFSDEDNRCLEELRILVSNKDE